MVFGENPDSPPTNSDSSPISNLIPAASVWQTPPFRPEGFQFEIQISSLGSSYDPERVRQSIRGHDLGEYESVISKSIAAEWGYSFIHLDGQTDGAGRRIEAGYPTPPQSRAECLNAVESFLHRQYIDGRDRPWASLNGHYPWHHYAAEFGFDQIGSEIGENINSYQWHIALTRGAARQYGRPWFIDFSPWHGPSVTDYSEGRIWGEYSGPDHGHSMSLFERSLFMSYMAGAGQITVQAGGAIAFQTDQDEQGLYRLSPYGEVCRRFRAFTLDHPDVGIAYTPFAVVLDFHHGAYPGFGKRKAFGVFDYNDGDNMTWSLIDRIWPGGWEVMGKKEVGALVNGPYGDRFDILLQNASQEVLDSYPCLIPSGDIRFSDAEVERLRAYIRQGGVLILNTAYLDRFPEYATLSRDSAPFEIAEGEGRVIVYGPDFQVDSLGQILEERLKAHLPVEVSPGVQYLVNLKSDRILVTLINNEGVSKEPKLPPVVDPSISLVVSVRYRGSAPLRGIRKIKDGTAMERPAEREATLPLPAGGVAIVEFLLD